MAVYLGSEKVGVTIEPKIDTLNASLTDTLTKYDIQQGVTNIPEYAFYNRKALQQITLPPTIKTIGSNAFAYSSLISFVFPETDIAIETNLFYRCQMLESISISNVQTTIPQQMCYYATKLKEIIIPNSVQTIGSQAFYYASGLEYVKMSENVTELKVSNFRNCSKLKTIDFGTNSKLSIIQSTCFTDCKSLEHLVFPDSLTTIGQSAFWRCSGLLDVTFGQNITSLGSQAFNACTSCMKYDFSRSAQIPTIASDTFKSIPETCKIYVPDTLYDEWIIATNWVNFAANIAKASEMPT